MDARDAWRTLYAAAPEDFVKERDRLVKELKAAGQGDASAALKKAKKPALPVWALNQVAQHRPEVIEALLDAGAAMAALHQALAEGGKAQAGWKGGAAEYRQAIAQVVAAARGVLVDAGHGADAGALRRIERSLESLPFAAEPQREALREGHLGEELSRDEAGDGLALEAALLASAAPPAGSTAPKSRPEPAAAPSRPPPRLHVVRNDGDSDAAAKAAEAAALARKRREEARARRAEADHANRAATAAEQAARDLLDELARARKALEATQAAVAAAEARLAAERERAEAAQDLILGLEASATEAAESASAAKSAAAQAEKVAVAAERAADEE